MAYAYEFGSFIGPAHRWFAWRPVRLFDGRWTWLRNVVRRRVQLHSYLTGPQSYWWSYCLPGEE